MRSHLLAAGALVLVVGVGGSSSTGCSNRADTGRAAGQPDRADQGSSERKTSDASKALEARGQELKRQGDETGGERLIEQSRVKQEGVRPATLPSTGPAAR